jgi:hypothetical protein
VHFQTSVIDPPLRYFLMSLYCLSPDPAGINLPMMTFSLSPSKWSTLPAVAASVSTFVVSWKDAAEIKLWVLKEAFVMPSSRGSAAAGLSS